MCRLRWTSPRPLRAHGPDGRGGATRRSCQYLGRRPVARTLREPGRRRRRLTGGAASISVSGPGIVRRPVPASRVRCSWRRRAARGLVGSRRPSGARCLGREGGPGGAGDRAALSTASRAHSSISASHAASVGGFVRRRVFAEAGVPSSRRFRLVRRRASPVLHPACTARPSRRSAPVGRASAGVTERGGLVGPAHASRTPVPRHPTGDSAARSPIARIGRYAPSTPRRRRTVSAPPDASGPGVRRWASPFGPAQRVRSVPCVTRACCPRVRSCRRRRQRGG